jgi:hypothetical protein
MLDPRLGVHMIVTDNPAAISGIVLCCSLDKQIPTCCPQPELIDKSVTRSQRRQDLPSS